MIPFKSNRISIKSYYVFFLIKKRKIERELDANMSFVEKAFKCIFVDMITKEKGGSVAIQQVEDAIQREM